MDNKISQKFTRKDPKWDSMKSNTMAHMVAPCECYPKSYIKGSKKGQHKDPSLLIIIDKNVILYGSYGGKVHSTLNCCGVYFKKTLHKHNNIANCT